MDIAFLFGSLVDGDKIARSDSFWGSLGYCCRSRRRARRRGVKAEAGRLISRNSDILKTGGAKFEMNSSCP